VGGVVHGCENQARPCAGWAVVSRCTSPAMSTDSTKMVCSPMYRVSACGRLTFCVSSFLWCRWCRHTEDTVIPD
jgi:hypothetical protein